MPYAFIIAFLLLQFLWATCTAGAAAARPRSNVLYLVADDLRPEFGGAYGQSQVKTPNVDKLAAGSLVFEKAYCQQAVCGPSECAQCS